MKALTLTEPWATLIAIGAKTIETRSWSTRYRGPIAIHAAKGLPKPAAEFLAYDDDALLALHDAGINPVSGLVDGGFVWNDYDLHCLRHWGSKRMMQLTRGCVIATAELIGCYRTEFVTAHCSITAREKAFGDYTPGRFAFRLANIVRLPEPIPATGALGFWEWDSPAEAEGRAA